MGAAPYGAKAKGADAPARRLRNIRRVHSWARRYQLPTTARVIWRADDFVAPTILAAHFCCEEVKRGDINFMKIGTRTLVPDSEAKAWQERTARASK